MAVKSLNQKQQLPQAAGVHVSGQMVIGLLFLVALVSFEIFNFDTTRFALSSLMGDISFAGLRWASVLALAFCAIDFAGLLRFFMPEEKGSETPVEVWYLMGAWLLGATMNALMTWWAVSLALVEHDLGNEVLSRQQLLEVVPVFVAVLVWLTRILFIGAFTVAGGYLFDFDRLRSTRPAQPPARPAAARQSGSKPVGLPHREPRRQGQQPRPMSAPPLSAPPALRPVTEDLPPFLEKEEVAEEGEQVRLIPALLQQSQTQRARNRPPRS